MDTLTYTDRCVAAATAQGLDPVVDALTAAGLPVELEQTGGFTMVATVRSLSGVVTVTDDDGYSVARFTGTSWDDGDCAETYTFGLDLAAMLDTVRDLVDLA
jgi:hypothetical protein